MTQITQIKVLTVDDHPLLLEGIASVIEGEKDIVLVGEAANGQEAIDSFRRFRPHVTLMDLQLPGMNGLEAMLKIREDFPNARFIVLTTFRGDVLAVRALKAGASGYLLKSMIRDNLLDMIRMVHAGRRCIPPEVAVEIADHIAQENLTEREIEILRAVSIGKANKMIASRLAISEATVKKHLKNILQKLGANDRTHAVTIAMKRGFLDA